MYKKMNNQIAQMLYEMAEFYEMEDVPFKPRAYQRAAMTIESLDEELFEIYKRGGVKELDKIPTIGAGIANHIESIFKTGSFLEYDKFKKKLPVKWNELTKIQGIGSKTIRELYKKLKIKNINDLEKAAKSGKISKIKGFGKKVEENILEGIEFGKKEKGRFLLGEILPISKRIKEELKKVSGVNQVEVAGSIRRKKETIGDMDFLITTKDPKKVIDFFVSLKEVEKIFGKGKTKASVRLKNGINADIRVLKPEEFGSALQYFTGNKSHNIKLRKIAIKKGYKLSEYGLFRKEKRMAGKNEEDIYKKLGLKYMEPELRTDSGEIEASLKNKLPKNLISYNSVIGDLQVQTNWSDGSESIEEMAKEAKKIGLKYIAITDHTKSLAMTNGLDEKRLDKQIKEIKKINKKLKGFKILKSAEINILKDGSLDIKDKMLKKLDIVSIAVHSNFKMSKVEMTKRIITAMKNPHVNILFHPTGRIIKKRPPYEIDIDEIIKTAKKYGVALEINSYKDRLDLKDSYIKKAVEIGAKMVIDSDAHSSDHFSFLNLGIAQARRGWAEKNDILNTLPVDKFLKNLKSLKK